MPEDPLCLLWLQPSTGENVSGRRDRIAEYLEEWGIEVTIRDASGLDSFGAITEAVRGNYDVIVGNVRVGLYLGYVLSRVLRKPLVGDVSDSLEDIDHLPEALFEVIRRFEWWVLDRTEACFFVESGSYTTAQKRGLEPILARNAVDYERFENPSEWSKRNARRILEDHGVALQKPVATYIGSMIPEYHLEEVGEAAELTPEWEFVFIGEERGAGIRDIVSGVENAHFLGAYDYDLVPGFLYHSDAGLCLVDKEQPLKVMEYGAAGLPTLGYSGKLRENFTDDEIVFIDSDPPEISDALERIASEPERSRKYGNNLQRRAEENSWRAVAKNYYGQIVELSEG